MMNQQPLASQTRIQGQYHFLILESLGYLLPLSLLGGGIAIAQSSPSSDVKPLPSLEQGSASSLESIQPSVSPTQPTATPDYESIPPMRLRELEATPETNSLPKVEQEPKTPETVEAQKPPHETPRNAPHETPRNAPHEEAQANQKLKPIQPLVNPSSSQPEVSPPSKPEPTVKFEPRQPQSNPHPIYEWQPQSPPAEEETVNANQDFIDINGYPQPGENNLPAPRVEVSERDSNCTTVIENGQLVRGSCDVPQQKAPSQPPLVEVERLPALPQNFQQPKPPQPREAISTYTPPTDLPELKLPGNGDSGMIFPLSRATPISSNYGWRIHPIYGNRRFHTGTDFVAPEGTPVVAAKSGRVILADYHSGYGLIVGLRHDGENESRYAHLSQIHVKPGQWVEQGTVIGRVGNTGLSTGPHLHFEWRIRKGSRWIAVNAGDQLIAARSNLDPTRIHFSDITESEEQIQEENFLAYLPEILASLPRPPASWMSLPELPFLNHTNFAQAYDRRASLTRFSQRRSSVLALPFSLPKVLASVFNWKPPQLFAQEELQPVSPPSQPSSETQFTYHPLSPEEKNQETYQQVSEFLAHQENISSLTNLDGLGTFNFSAPRPNVSQELSDKRF